LLAIEIDFHFHWWTAFIKQRLLFSPCKLCFFRTFPFTQIIITFLQLVFSTSVATLKCRPVLHYCVVTYFGPWDRGFYVVYIWKKSSAHALGASMGWHVSFPLMNSFNNTEAAIFLTQTMLPLDFPFFQMIATKNLYKICLLNWLFINKTIFCMYCLRFWI